MGLDQYAYAKNRGRGCKPFVIHTWRKHPNLQGWMENLWVQRNNNPFVPFNCKKLYLRRRDLYDLEEAVRSQSLPETEGFFFGQNADRWNAPMDLHFIEKAHYYMFHKCRVYYTAWF